MANVDQIQIFSSKIHKEYELILSCNDLAGVLENTVAFIRQLRNHPITAKFIRDNEECMRSKQEAFNNAAFDAVEEEFIYRANLPNATKEYKDKLLEFQLSLEAKKNGISGNSHPINRISKELYDFGFPDNTLEADKEASPLKKFENANPNRAMSYREVRMQSECEFPFLWYRFCLLEEIATFRKSEFFSDPKIFVETKNTKETRRRSFDLAIKYAHEINLIFASKPIKYSFQFRKLPIRPPILSEYLFPFEDILKELQLLKTRVDIFLMEQNLQDKEEIHTPLTQPEKNLTKAIKLIKEAFRLNPETTYEKVTDYVLDRENPPPYERSKIPKIIREYKLDPRAKKTRGLGKKSKNKK